MKNKSCFLIGHREAGQEVLLELRSEIERHICKYGVNEFLVGHYGNFDRIAAEAVVEAKMRHPGITLSLLLAYHPAERPIKLPSGFDRTYYPEGMEGVPRKVAIVRANRCAVDHTGYLIAYAWHPASNTQNIVEYARRKAVHTGRDKLQSYNKRTGGVKYSARSVLRK